MFMCKVKLVPASALLVGMSSGWLFRVICRQYIRKSNIGCGLDYFSMSINI